MVQTTVGTISLLFDTCNQTGNRWGLPTKSGFPLESERERVQMIERDKNKNSSNFFFFYDKGIEIEIEKKRRK